MNFRKIISLSLVSIFSISTSSLRADEKKPVKEWTHATEGSLVSTNGNTKSNSTAGKHTSKFEKNKTSLEVSGGGLGARDKDGVTAERYFANEKGTYKVSDKNYVFEKYAWDKDRFSGIQDRHDAQLGLGREFINTSKHELIGEFGGGYINEDRTTEPTNDFVAGRVYSKYQLTLSETSKFTQDAEYLHNFEDGEDYRVNTETALLATLTNHLALKLSYTWKYVADPPVGFGSSDSTTLVSLVATY